MWTVVYLAPTKQKAREIAALLENNGILIKIRPLSKKADDGETSYEILVCESDVEAAHGIIFDMGL